MKSALVTGANGFVGKAVVSELHSQGIEVTAVVRSQTDAFSSLKGVHTVSCDMQSYNLLPDLVSKNRPEVFYHFAWGGTAGPDRANERIQLANIQGACDAVHAAKAIGCSRFIFASSIMEYEVQAEVAAMKNPGINSVYSTAKMTADYLTRILASSSGLEFVSALISNIYGPGENSPRLINTCIRKLLNGEHIALSPGEQLYDFIYVTDAARAFSCIGTEGKNGSTYYIGNRVPRKLKSFLEELRDVVAPGVTLGFGEIPFHGVSLTYKEFNTDLIFQDTEYEPKISFTEGIRKTRDGILKEIN